MTLRFVETERLGAVLKVTIARPERLNALHSPAHFELACVFDEFEADAGLDVAILTGTGNRAFCAGNDLKFQAEGGSMERPESGFGGLTKRFGRKKPVIAAVNGIAFGGGFEIVLACDIAVAVRTARFSFPEVKRGLVPLAGVHTLPRQLPLKMAMGMLLTGAELNADDALGLGLVNEVVDDAVVAAIRWAEYILRGSPMAIRACLDMVERSLATTDMRDAATANYESLDALRASPDFREGPLAFTEKRSPKWRS